MVDASTACRMNPLAALGMDQSTLMRDLGIHGGLVYPGLKGRDGAGVPLGYISEGLPDLHYKHDVSLESRKATNGYVGLYKSAPPGLQKPLLVPGGAGDALGLDKQTDLGMNGGAGYLRLPWMSPYPDAGMYPFLDSTKYAAFSMYKASLMSQPSPYLPQHLAYQSLCAGAGGGASGTDRIFYVPPYPPTPISSPLAPPMRIPPATVAATPLSPLVHCQDKTLPGLGPRVHHEPSAFGQQLQQPPPHHASHDDRLHGGKAVPVSASKGSSGTGTMGIAGSGLSTDATAALLMQSPRSALRHGQPPAPPPPLMDSTLDFQKPLPRGPPSSSSSSPSMSHSFYMSGLALEHFSPARSSSHKCKPKEGGLEHRSSGGEKKSSKTPPKAASDKCVQHTPGKDPADKPLDLSAKIEFGTPPIGFNPKLEALAKLGHSPTALYGLHPSRELLKETGSPPSSAVCTSSKLPERPEIISTLHSSWVVPGPGPPPSSLLVDSGQNKVPSVIKNKTLERVIPQQRSSSCPRIGESNCSPPTNPATTVVTPVGRPASASPSPNLNGDWPKSSTSLSEKTSMANCASSQASAKPAKTSKRLESQEINYKPQHPHLENGHTPNHHYLPQNEAFLPPGLPYGNRYLPYPVPESISLPHIPLPGKGPVYPHPALLGSSSLYPARLAPKQGLPYGLPPSHGEFLTYHDSQDMVHPLMSPHPALDAKVNERLERRFQSQEKHRASEDGTHRSSHAVETADTARKPEKEAEKSVGQGSRPLASAKDPSQDGTDGGSERHGAYGAKRGDPSKSISNGDRGNGTGKEPELMQLLLSSQAASRRPPEPDGQPEVASRHRPQGQDCLPLGACQNRTSPEDSRSEESPAEQSPLPDLPEHQTLRCARTSGDRTSEAGKRERTRPQVYDELNREASENPEAQDQDDDGHNSSKTRRSSLAKRIANSSGYVGDRFKCVTTELYADSSKLSREQRALQMEGLSQEDSNLSQPAAYSERAMLRFSELELKEKEGGATASQELAGGRNSEAAWEAGKEGVGAASGNNRPSVLQRCAGQGQGPPPAEREAGRAVAPPEAPEKPQGAVAPGGKRPVYRDEGQAQQSEEDGPPLGEKRPRLVSVPPDAPLGPVHADPPSPDGAARRRQRATEPQGAGVDGGGGEAGLRLRRHGDPEKPKGKRQCKTKHLSLRERRRAAQPAGGHTSLEHSPEHKVSLKRSTRKRSASLSDCGSDPSPVKARPASPRPAVAQSPLQRPSLQPSPPLVGNPPADPPASRPVPPEVRRLIVNKNAGETLLQRAARLGYEEVVLYCLENKVCDVNHRDNAGYCALHEACAHGWLSIAQHLLEYGADINCNAQDGTRPLHDAVENDHLDVVRLLLSYGADPTLATYSGRGLLKMTHSEMMECFLLDYFADLQGRDDDDPRLRWELYGSVLCEPAEDWAAFDILANPPGPGEDEEEEEGEQRGVFEFEFSDRPLLPCYNIQVSLSQGPRNWLLLSDVLKRLKMSARTFRAAFAHIEVATIAEAEFYKQASLSQLFSCPQELEGFLPDSKELLDLVEISGELVTLLGSSIECLDDHWDSGAIADS
ncbi:BCL-6 corepressor-like isoform X1 [Paramormyrops kingsleyae]|uniref:BCL6 corepressor n=1 Tax=Paramormyrops kingsleyae TaxID=1676925 RepID=A0A3B3SS08_9TELE|nr:BCL-6 corepressor-like isoform X1 [Paramormyrops kingsleyae]XP_023679724.1 BCL-6 corepressor-like isoform X1 [Paramormyrops kingsleyae]XP_023679725.1 BCL-6 corepressor-like isoform X1 [Paramormyrops kingsleyae]